MTPAAMRSRASRTPILPLCGSIEAKAIMMSELAAAASATSSFEIRLAPISDSLSTVNITRPILRSR